MIVNAIQVHRHFSVWGREGALQFRVDSAQEKCGPQVKDTSCKK